MTALSTNGHVNSLEETAEAIAPPLSGQAEEAVLGSVLKNGLSIADVAALLKPEHFYDHERPRSCTTVSADGEMSHCADFLVAGQLSSAQRLPGHPYQDSHRG